MIVNEKNKLKHQKVEHKCRCMYYYLHLSLHNNNNQGNDIIHFTIPKKRTSVHKNPPAGQ